MYTQKFAINVVANLNEKMSLTLPQTKINNIKTRTMSKSIWKFPLEVTDAQTLKMPTGAEVLTVQSQNELPFLWALVDTEALTTFYEVRVFGTGHVIPSDLDLTYLGTYIPKRGERVFHYFLLKPASTL